MSQTTINELELKVLDLQKQLAQITAAAVDLTILVAQMRNTAAKAPKAAPAPVVEAAAPAPVLPVATAPVVDVKEVAPVATPAPETAAPAADAASKRVRRSDEQVIDEVVRGVGRYPASWNAERRAAADLIVAERRASQAAPATPAPETAAPESFDPPANGLFSPVVEGTPEVQPVSDTVEV